MTARRAFPESYAGTACRLPRARRISRRAPGFPPLFASPDYILVVGGDVAANNLVEGMTIENGRLVAVQGGEGSFDVTFCGNVVLDTWSYGTATAGSRAAQPGASASATRTSSAVTSRPMTSRSRASAALSSSSRVVLTSP